MTEAAVAAVALAVTLTTFVVSRIREGRLRRAELVRNYTNDFYADPRITTIFMEVDHGRYCLDEALLGTDVELAIIRVLDYMNVLGHNWQRRVIPLRDITPTTLGYAAIRIHADPCVTWYLRKVEEWDAQRYGPGSGFGYSRELSAALATYPVSPPGAGRWQRLAVAFRRHWHDRRGCARFRIVPVPPRSVTDTAREVQEAIDSQDPHFPLSEDKSDGAGRALWVRVSAAPPRSRRVRTPMTAAGEHPTCGR